MSILEPISPDNATQDAEFIRTLAECLAEADRFASRDGKETYVMLTDPVVQMIVAGLRTVYKRSLMH